MYYLCYKIITIYNKKYIHSNGKHENENKKETKERIRRPGTARPQFQNSFLALAYSALSTDPPAPPLRVLWESTKAL